MKPKLIHSDAMSYSFKANQALEEGRYKDATNFYEKAAELESIVAEFYFDKPDLEPTRSVMIRSAAFLNLKAGLVENAKKFILFGLLNTKDELIRDQLNNALEMVVSINSETEGELTKNFNYLNLLRKRSVHYIIEPTNLAFGRSASVEMVKDFFESYLKSLKAYATSRYKKINDVKYEAEENITKELEKLINPLITNSGYGSFKFSIANDFLHREGESKEVVELKSNIISKYHYEIFINPLSNDDIEKIKEAYTEEEVNDIFRPLVKIKSNIAPYKVGFYDSDSFKKNYLNKIINKQRKQLFPVKQISQEDIGELESSIIHKRNSQSGRVSKKTIFKEQLKSYEADIKINIIEPTDIAPLLLSEEIYINMNFSSNKGFTFSFDDFRIDYTDIEHSKAFKGFHLAFYDKLLYLAKKEDKNSEEQEDWDLVKKLIANPNKLKFL